MQVLCCTYPFLSDGRRKNLAQRLLHCSISCSSLVLCPSERTATPAEVNPSEGSSCSRDGFLASFSHPLRKAPRVISQNTRPHPEELKSSLMGPSTWACSPFSDWDEAGEKKLVLRNTTRKKSLVCPADLFQAGSTGIPMLSGLLSKEVGYFPEQRGCGWRVEVEAAAGGRNEHAGTQAIDCLFLGQVWESAEAKGAKWHLISDWVVLITMETK